MNDCLLFGESRVCDCVFHSCISRLLPQCLAVYWMTEWKISITLAILEQAHNITLRWLWSQCYSSPISIIKSEVYVWGNLGWCENFMWDRFSILAILILKVFSFYNTIISYSLRKNECIYSPKDNYKKGFNSFSHNGRKL